MKRKILMKSTGIVESQTERERERERRHISSSLKAQYKLLVLMELLVFVGWKPILWFSFTTSLTAMNMVTKATSGMCNLI